MTRLLIAVAIAASLALPAQADAQRLITLITSAEPQTQLMALILTTQAIQQGAEVRVLLCGPGGDLALEDAPESATAGQPPRGASPQGLLQGIIEAGAVVEVCAIYLPGRGAAPDALIGAVGVARPADIASVMLHPATRVWSF
jgi:hypothetical protein